MDTIRLILNLPRCGGTLFSRLLSAHPDVFLLSEVHPANQGADIRARLSEFFGTELPESVTGWHDSIRHVTGTESRHVVVRDHTHVDFTAATGTSYRLVTLEALADYRCLTVSLLRNPVDQYLSCLSRRGMARYMTPELFSAGYVAYAQKTAALNQVRYEDLVARPEDTMRHVCGVLELSYAPAMLSEFAAVTSVTGDGDQASRGYALTSVASIPKREGWSEAAATFRAFGELVEVCRRLSYEL